MSEPQSPTPYPPPSAAVRARSFVTRVLWTVIPFGTLGLCGWVPAVHVARQRRTPASWWWLAGLVAATVAECVLVSVVPKGGGGQAAAGAFTVGYMITATVYAWVGCGTERPVARMVPYPYPGYDAAWMPAGFERAPSTPYPPAPYPSPAPYPTPTQPYPVGMVAPATPAPAAAQDMAAEIQAELRELRGFLGGEDAR